MATVSSKSVSVDEIEDLLTCSMCSQTLSDPRSLPCLHNFCKLCLAKYVDRLRGADKNIETFPCPRCRSEFTLKSNQDVAEISSNYFIKNMLEMKAIQRKAKESPVCSRCQDSAINHCTTCEVFLCKKCSELHSTWFNAMKNHDVLSVEELSNPGSQVTMRSKLYCMKHKHKILEYYCEICQELCCIDCVVLNHQKPNHSCMSVSEVTQKQRETLQSSCTTLDEKLSEGKEALNIFCDVMKALKKNAKTAKDQIKEQKDNILKVVAEKLGDRAKEMNEEVDKVYGELHSELSKQHDEINDYLDKVQGSVSFPRNLLKRGSIEEILSSQKVIDENIEKLRNKQPENLTAVNDGGIEYVPGDIGSIKLEEVVDTMGFVETPKLSIRVTNQQRNVSLVTSQQRNVAAVALPERPTASGLLEDKAFVKWIKSEILKAQSGLSATRLEILYKQKFKKALPSSIMQELKFRPDIARVDEPIEGRFLLYAPQKREPAASYTNPGQTTINTLPCYLPEVGISIIVYISHTENLSCFYVSRHDSVSGELSEEILKHYKGSKYNSEAIPLVSPGLIFCAQFTEDEYFYRASVLEVVDSKHIEVLYVDFGNKEVIPVQRLRVLISEFRTQPIQVYQCCLYGVQPADKGQEWSEDAINKFDVLTSAKELRMTVHEVDDKILSVSLVDVSTELDIAEEMKKSGLAVSTKNLESTPSSSSSSVSSLSSSSGATLERSPFSTEDVVSRYSRQKFKSPGTYNCWR